MSFLSVLTSRSLIQDCSDPELDQKIPPGSSFYVGFDPTSPNLHIGNLIQAIVLIHLAKSSGLKPIILIGGSTGSIGDPSGRSSERQLLDRSTIDANVASHTKIMQCIFARAGVECQFVDNYQWTASVSVLDFLRDVGKHFTVNYMIAKEVVKTRLEGDGISFTEFSYMLLQAFDFLHLYQNHNCRLQFGGSDQWGNVTAGLELIRRSIQGEAFAFSVPLCVDSEGKKFGKTAAGAIWINPEGLSPYEFHQYWLNTADADLEKLLKIFTFLPIEEISTLVAEHAKAPEKRLGQTRLADEVTSLVHGADAAKEANISRSVLFGGTMQDLSESQLLSIFSGVPSSEIPRTQVTEITVSDLLVSTKLVPSKGEARRLIQNGGAYLNNERLNDGNVKIVDLVSAEKNVIVLRSGKKNYHLVKFVSIVIATCLCACLVLSTAHADAPPTPLYRQPAQSLKVDGNTYDDEIAVSPKPGWRRLPEHRSRRERTSPWWADVLLWIPNRVMDFIDIFRVDLGAGPAIGGVVRASKYAQFGYRRMYPFSLRVGDFGRKLPFLVETTDERGLGDTFRQSSDRNVCESEVGAGLDLGIGAYAGICGEELLDFFAGIVFIDLEADDI